MATGPLMMTMAAVQINSDSTLPCQVEGRTTGIGMALPGVTLTFLQDGEAKASTSSDGNGAYRITLSRGSDVVTAALAGFELAKRDIVPTEAPCRQRLDLVLTILPAGIRTTLAIQDQLSNGERDSRWRADRTRLPAQRFAPLPVIPGTDAGRTDGQNEPDADVALLLPPGFSNEAFADAIAITGESARLDRGAIDDRLGAIQRGELAFPDGRPPPAFGPGPTGLPPGALPSGGPPSEGRFGRPGDLAEGGPPGSGSSGPPGFAPGGFPGGGPRFPPGGRGGGQNRLTAMADYTFGGSALDAHPFRLRSDALNDRQPYTRQSFGTTIGGPFKLPGIYNGTGRTRFTASFNGSRGSTLFDQYATVPTEAMRAGDFSGLAIPIIDPATGSAFVNNQIPVDRMSSAATTLLRYLPSANLSGTARNYHYTTTTASVTDAINVRFTHNLGTAITGRPGGRARAAGPGERGGPFGGPGGPFGAGRGNHVSITAQLQYRRESSDQANVLATLGGTRRSTALTVPVSLNVMRDANSTPST